jgi:hypothetical protein
MATVRIRRALVWLAVLAAALAGCNDDSGSPGDGGIDPNIDPTMKIKPGAWDIAAGASAGGPRCFPFSQTMCEVFYTEELDLDQQAAVFGFDCEFTVLADGTITGSCAAGSVSLSGCVATFPAFQATGRVAQNGGSFSVTMPLVARLGSTCPFGGADVCNYRVVVSGIWVGDECPPSAPQPGSWRPLNARY